MGRNDGKTENLTDRLIHNLCRLTKGAGNSTTMCKNGGQHAGLFPTPPGGEEELLQWYQRVGVARIAGFLFPVLTPGFAGEKLLFPNIALLGKTGGFFADFSLLYPLLAGVVILAAIRRLKGMIRGAVILGSGLLPVALRLFTGTDLFAFAVRKLYRSTIWIQVAILSLVALYVGARTIQAHDNSQGRWISPWATTYSSWRQFSCRRPRRPVRDLKTHHQRLTPRGLHGTKAIHHLPFAPIPGERTALRFLPFKVLDCNKGRNGLFLQSSWE